MFEMDLMHLALVGLSCLAAVLKEGIDVHHQYNEERERRELVSKLLTVKAWVTLGRHGEDNYEKN
jgi:hypothetical protein